MDVPGAEAIAKRLQKAMGIGEDGEKIEQEQKPDPAMAAKALRDAADADKTKAETEGQEIKNAADFMALQQMIALQGQQMQAILQGISQMMAMQGGGQPQGGPPPGGAPPQPGAPPMPPPEMSAPPMPTPPEAPPDGLPPMVELEAA
jgi:hypothetical protein